MILTTKARYAVMAIIEIADNDSENNAKPTALSEISKSQNISLSYLEQIFSLLKKAKIVKSIKGPGGGYVLEKKHNDITIAQIIKAIGEPIKMTNCSNKKSNCTNIKKNSKCKTHHLWQGLEKNIFDYLNSISLEDVCQ
ncbi:MAG: Rrf2 family transcriptional regulator [Rickettsiales bacterium]|nr:Rrf2 family transcriptional regulator [Rickettsiales bacterium]